MVIATMMIATMMTRTRKMRPMTMSGECSTSKEILRFARTSFCLPHRNLTR